MNERRLSELVNWLDQNGLIAAGHPGRIKCRFDGEWKCLELLFPNHTLESYSVHSRSRVEYILYLSTRQPFHWLASAQKQDGVLQTRWNTGARSFI